MIKRLSEQEKAFEEVKEQISNWRNKNLPQITRLILELEEKDLVCFWIISLILIDNT
jgi:hypothetical protein